MRITEGVIYLSQPIGGCWTLEGPAVIGTTWLDYTMPEAEDGHMPSTTQEAAMLGTMQGGPTSGAMQDGASLHGRRLLIPITNVIAVVVPDEADAAYRAPLP
jgi:hypothetical protein